MEFQEVFAQLRQRTGLSQSEVAERLFVTRQAVSRWERGMPLNDDILAKNTDGSFNEQYCMWCWDGEGFAQDCTMEEMVEHCLPHMPLGRTDPEACRAYMRSLLPTLGRWKEN